MIMGGIAQSQVIFGLRMEHQLKTGETAVFRHWRVRPRGGFKDTSTVQYKKQERLTMTTIGY